MATGTAYKSVIKNAAYIFFIKLFPAIALLAVTILYARVLSEEDYGNYQNYLVKILLLGTLAYAGLPVTIITYSADVIKHLARQIGTKQVALYGLWLSAWTLVFCYLQWQGLHLNWLLSAGLILMYVVHSVQESLLIAAKNMKGLLLFNFFYGLYFLFIHIYALYDYNLEALLLYLLLGMVVRGVGMAMIINLTYKRVGVNEGMEMNIGKVRNLWLHLGFYDLMQNIFRFIDKFILSILLSAGLYAIYVNGAMEIPILPYLLGAVSSSVLVQLASGKAGHSEEPHKLMFQSGKLLSCIVFPLFFFLLFFSRELFVVVFTEKYLTSVPIFMMMLLVLPLRAYNYTVLLQHLHKGALINKGALLDLVLALAMMYPLYYVLGLPGIVLSFVLSTYVQVGYYLFHTAKITKVPIGKMLPLKNWIGKLLIFGVVLFLLRYLLPGSLESKYVLIAGAVGGLTLSLVSFAVELKRSKEV